MKTRHGNLKKRRIDPAASVKDSRMFTLKQWETAAKHRNLSPTELLVVKGVFDGLKETAIARRLKMSPHTVHTHLVRLYAKLQVSCRVELVLVVVCAMSRTP
jgi:DNA-binding NarL/FixJ family response regulator